jgi:hypothetical protein
MSKPLTFRELSIGDCFISFPTDGDDSGHGGYRKGSYLLRKTRACVLGESWVEGEDNYENLRAGHHGGRLTPESQVLLVLL